MQTEILNKQNIPDIEKLQYNSIEISDVKCIEERMCYDSYWEVFTNLGKITLKMYDGISKNEMLKRCRNVNCIAQLLQMQPKVFYYD
jgi:hypothetical protein